jgi:hypothetical protein
MHFYLAFLSLSSSDVLSTLFSNTPNPYVRFQVFTAVSVKMAVFLVIAPYTLIEVYQHFSYACFLSLGACDGSRQDLWNVSELLSDFMALPPRRQSFSISIFCFSLM